MYDWEGRICRKEEEGKMPEIPTNVEHLVKGVVTKVVLKTGVGSR